MESVALFLALLVCLCSGLQPGVEYHYRYSGRVATGIIDVKNQFSAVGIQADVEVQVAEDHTAIFQFSHVEVGDFHDELHCDMRAPLPIDYHRMEHGVELLEKPFRVMIDDDDKKPIYFKFLEVPTEPTWITNIRKSVVNIFRLTPFGQNVSRTEEARPDAISHLDFGIMEENMMGRCTNWYGIHKISHEETDYFNRDYELEDDIQREGTESAASKSGAKGRKSSKGSKSSKTSSKSSKTSKTPSRASSAPSLRDTLWKVHKTTDFNLCEYLVTMKGGLHEHEMQNFQRSSLGTFIIRGDSEAMRIEKAYIEGEIIIKPHYDREGYNFLSNQTLELKAVRVIEEQLTIDYEPHQCSSWRYEVEHSIADHHEEGAEPSLEQILTGVELTPAILQEIKTLAISEIEDLSHRMPRNPTHKMTLVDEMNHIVEAVSILHSEELQEIHNKYLAEAASGNKVKLHIFYQALVAAATEPSVELLLTLIPESKFRVDYEDIVYNFFSSLPKLTVSPTLIPKIMDVVMQLPWPDATLADKSSALLSFSMFVGNMCFDNNKRNWFWEDTCEKDHVCDLTTIANVYIPYLKQGLENEENLIWQRVIYLQSIIYLRTPFSLDILRPFVMGDKEYHPNLSFNAIMALSRPFLPALARAEVMYMMMPIFENTQESHEMRSVAFLVMASWQRDYSWWSRMAQATWNDPSNKVANLISTTIHSAALMEGGGSLQEIASQVDHLIKPAVPASISLSTNQFMMEMLFSNRFNKPLAFAWLASTKSFFPEKMAIKISGTVLFGFPAEFLMEAQTTFGQWAYAEYMNMFLPTSSKVTQDAIDIVQSMYNEIKEKLHFETTGRRDTNILAVFQRDIHFMFTYASHGYLVLPFAGSNFINSPRYSRHRDAFIAYPTDVGLPVIAKHVIDSSFWIEFSQVPGASGRKTSVKVTVDASTAYRAECKSLVPWSEKFAAGVSYVADASILLPFVVHLGFNIRIKELQVTLEPLTDDKINVFEAHSNPRTVQFGRFPTNVRFQTNEYKEIDKYHDCAYHDKFQVFPTEAGLNVEMEWEGSIQNPFNVWNLFRGKYFRSISTLKDWETHVTFDPEASATKSITFTFSYVSTKKSGTQVIGEQTSDGQDFGDYSQISQSSGGFDYSQFSQSTGGQESFDGEVDVFDDVGQSSSRSRLITAQGQVIGTEGGNVKSVSVDFDLHGATEQRYAFLFTWAKSLSGSNHVVKTHFTWIKDVPVGTLGEPHSTCLYFKVTKPHFEPFISKEELLRTDFHSTFSFDLHDGTDCNTPPILDIEGTMDISREQMEDAKKKLSTEQCGSEEPEMHPIDFITTSLYDQINIKSKWTSGFTVPMKNWTYFAYDLVRGFYFPDIHYDYTVHNAQSEVVIDAHRCLETKEWHIHTTKEHEESVIENVKAPYLFDVFTSPAPADQTLHYDFFNGRQHQACVVTHDKVRTFDGVVYQYEPEECWHIMAMDISEYFEGSLEVRFHDGQWESRLLAPRWGLLVEMTPTTVKVNGEDHNKGDDRFDVRITSDGLIFSMNIMAGSVFKMTNDAIYLVDDEFFRAKLGGLCGNFDGEKTNDLIGPKGCIYTDHDLFVKSWTTPAEGCSGFSFLAKKRPVEEYQDSCPTVTHPPTGVTYPEAMQEPCRDWNYIERVEGDRMCRSLEPVPQCKPGCHAVFQETVPIKYDCKLVPEASDCAHKCYLQTHATPAQLYCMRD